MPVIALIALAAGLAAGHTLGMEHGEIARRVAGDGLPHCVSHAPDGAIGPCLPEFAVKNGARINAWAAGREIVFTRAATRRLTRDEFALLAGHEIAHYYLGRVSNSRADELAADRLGAELACRAGYDPVAGATLFRYLAADRLHPGARERQAAVLAVGCRVGTTKSTVTAMPREISALSP